MRNVKCKSESAFKAPYRKRVSVSPHSSPAKEPVLLCCRPEITCLSRQILELGSLLVSRWLTFSYSKFATFASNFQLIESIHSSQNLDRAYGIEHVSIVAWSCPKTTVFMLTREDKVDGLLTW